MVQNYTFPLLLTTVLIFLEYKAFMPFIQQSCQTQMPFMLLL